MPFVVTSTATPPITWHCPTCRRTERFACSERFRANANGKLVDIWLIYRCVRCDQTKNITVVERRPVARVPRPLLDAAIDNDPATARRLSRDVGLLKRAGARVAGGDQWLLTPPDGALAPAGGVKALRFEEPLLVRLDAILRVLCMEARAPSSMRTDRLRLWEGEIPLVALAQ